MIIVIVIVIVIVHLNVLVDFFSTSTSISYIIYSSISKIISFNYSGSNV